MTPPPKEVQLVVVALHERLSPLRGIKLIDNRRLNVYRSAVSGRLELMASTVSVSDMLININVRLTPAGVRISGRFNNRDHCLYGFSAPAIDFEATSSDEAARIVLGLIAPLIRI